MNRQSKYLLIFGGTQGIFERAKELGFKTIYVQKPTSYDKEIEKIVDHSYITDYINDKLLLRKIKELHEQTPLSAVLSFTEEAQLIVATINKALNLHGIDPVTVKRTSNKFQLRNTLDSKYKVISDLINNKRDLEDFIKEVKLPCIIKPINGVGSKGVSLIESNKAINTIKLEYPFLAEEYLEGTEYSIETFSFNGEHMVFGVTEKGLMGNSTNSMFVESSHKIPANLDDKGKNKFEKFINSFLDSIGLKDGPAHTEVIDTKNGLKLIETHTRPGGDYIPELVELTTGINLYELSMKWFTGDINLNEEMSKLMHSQGAAIKFFDLPSGTVETVVGLEEARKLEGVIRVKLDLDKDESIGEVTSSRDRKGYVIATGEDSEIAFSKCEEAINKVEVEYY